MHQLTAQALHHTLINGTASAQEITRYFLQRIDTLNPSIGAFLRTCPKRALAQAERIDQKKQQGLPLGPLAGVPIAIKDNIHIEGEISSCGSKFLTNYRAPFSATATRYLEAADAILIGKTNMDEFAMGSSTENSALQKTYNPWNLSCTPGGSSGGSAAAVAAGLVPLALGSDTGGSIRQPASFCGIVGFKPTYGRVSRYGLVAYGSSLDQIGPMTTTVADTALCMELLAQPCAQDATALRDPPPPYASLLKDNLKGIKIGVPWRFLEDLAQEPRALFASAIEKLQGLGAHIIDVDLDILRYSIATYYILATAEASTNLARFDGIRYGVRAPQATTLDEVYNLSKEEGFGKEVKRRILLGTYVLSAGYKDAYYKKAQKMRTLILQHYARAFTQCDLIATPASPFDAFEIGSIHDPLQMYLQDIYTIAINLAGLPAIAVPHALSARGRPLGLQLIGPQKADAQVLSAAHAFETITPRLTPPLEA